MGDRIRPHLGLIAGALPQIWATASAHVEGAKAQAATSSSSSAAASVAAKPGKSMDRSDTGAVVRRMRQ